MAELEAKQMAAAGTEAVSRLRIEKFKNGHPFLIFSKELPKRHSYLEYPDWKIKQVRLSKGGSRFITVRFLSEMECASVRLKNDLPEFHR